MSAFGRSAYRLFVLLLGIWTGSGIHDSLSGHFAWYADPVGWGNRPVVEGELNPWPFSTMLLLLATLVAGAVLWRYRGPARKEAIATVAATAMILAATLAWFVPQLGLMAGGTLDDAALIAHSRTWIVLNAVRIVLLVLIFYYALIAVARLGDAAPRPD